mgnify:FL=1
MKKKELIQPDYKIRKSENLVQAKFRLPLIEQRILAVCFSTINPTKNKIDNPRRFSVKEYCNLAGVETKNMQRALRDAVESLKNRTLSKYDTDLKRERIYGWLTHVDAWDDGNFDLYIHSELEQDLLAKKKYTEYVLKTCFNFRSKYSFRLYELASHWEYEKVKQISIESLREMLGLEEREYSVYAEFKRKVLNTSIKEINKHTEYFISILNEFRKNRKVTVIEIEIKKLSTPLETVKKQEKEKTKGKNSDIESWLSPNEEDELVESLFKVGIAASASIKLIKVFGINKVKECLDTTLSDDKIDKFPEGTKLSGVIINRLKDPDPTIVNKVSTDEDLSLIRSELMNWIQDEKIKYNPYRNGDKWVAIEINNKIINFLNPDFKEEVIRIVKK